MLGLPIKAVRKAFADAYGGGKETVRVTQTLTSDFKIDGKTIWRNVFSDGI